ncbi:isocitrate lyase/PEP mutase family protein [Pseudokordiimonas caeni]|uniref:isocitrate lyase/PEP mutase family protein n=1 Tax=Pseudokordiimonas caeni TaxID=2997908 RepID=UPI002810B8BF|nr:isocitrate lyase/phosphoenolpyruvate mutase family protein [Pseudokordiimonas caeni]
MPTQQDRARLFRSLHKAGDPLVLYNIWDAGSARAVAEAGAKAVATGSWSVADAQGYKDGQEIPLDTLLAIAERIAGTVDVPFTLDFEGGYAEDPAGVTANVRRAVQTGIVGINFEDQVVGGSGVYPVEAQAARIKAVRAAAETEGIDLFINARTDLFLQEGDRAKHQGLIAEAVTRAEAYKAAGADGFFVPALADPTLIRAVCGAVALPVNVMMFSGIGTVAEMAALGVARASYGPRPYREAMAGLKERFLAELAA